MNVPRVRHLPNGRRQIIFNLLIFLSQLIEEQIRRPYPLPQSTQVRILLASIWRGASRNTRDSGVGCRVWLLYICYPLFSICKFSCCDATEVKIDMEFQRMVFSFAFCFGATKNVEELWFCRYIVRIAVWRYFGGASSKLQAQCTPSLARMVQLTFLSVFTAICRIQL